MAENTVLKIQPGMSVRTITTVAQEANVIKSDILLYLVITYFYDPTTIQAGTYVFSEPVSVFDVAKKLATSDTDKQLLTITIPEGMTVAQIAKIVARRLSNFDTEEYLANTNTLEGYLFPETYFVPETFTAQDLIDLQRETYEEKIAPLREAIESSGFTEYEVLILASILEREASDEKSMRMVSGILQKRLDINMTLQADASIEFVLDKPLSELTPADLKIDSPYNTYLYPGLVPTPIGNPGLMAIEAVLYPIQSDNLFYLTAPDGTFYYAETFAKHKQNIARYLR